MWPRLSIVAGLLAGVAVAVLILGGIVALAPDQAPTVTPVPTFATPPSPSPSPSAGASAGASVSPPPAPSGTGGDPSDDPSIPPGATVSP